MTLHRFSAIKFDRSSKSVLLSMAFLLGGKNVDYQNNELNLSQTVEFERIQSAFSLHVIN